MLLKVGRHLRPAAHFKLIVGREDGENNFLEGYRKQFVHLRIASHAGPLTLASTARRRPATSNLLRESRRAIAKAATPMSSLSRRITRMVSSSSSSVSPIPVHQIQPPGMSEFVRPWDTSAALLDVRGLLCPLPVIRAQNRVRSCNPASCWIVVATDPGTLHDIPAWCRVHGHVVIDMLAAQP